MLKRAVLLSVAVISLCLLSLAYLAGAENVRKCSRRDLPIVVGRGEDGATTVAGTMIVAHMAGIRVFATGGIGLQRVEVLLDHCVGVGEKLGLKLGVRDAVGLAVGERDGVSETVGVGEKLGLKVEFHLTPNIGHWYPKEFSTLLDQALGLILPDGNGG